MSPQPLYGFSFSEPLSFRLAADGTDVYAVVRVSHTSCECSQSSASDFGLATLCFAIVAPQDDKELDFDEVIDAPLPKCPLEVSVSSHWLAIEGVQPAVAENPTPQEIAAMRKKSASTGGDQAPTRQQREVEGAAMAVKHVLSRELQLYYEKVAAAVTHGPDALRDSALASLAADTGLQPLLPYLVHLVTDEVTRGLRNLPLLTAIMRMVFCMLSNPHFHIEPYVSRAPQNPVPRVHRPCGLGSVVCDDAGLTPQLLCASLPAAASTHAADPDVHGGEEAMRHRRGGPLGAARAGGAYRGGHCADVRASLHESAAAAHPHAPPRVA